MCKTTSFFPVSKVCPQKLFPCLNVGALTSKPCQRIVFTSKHFLCGQYANLFWVISLRRFMHLRRREAWYLLNDLKNGVSFNTLYCASVWCMNRLLGFHGYDSVPETKGHYRVNAHATNNVESSLEITLVEDFCNVKESIVPLWQQKWSQRHRIVWWSYQEKLFVTAF